MTFLCLRATLPTKKKPNPTRLRYRLLVCMTCRVSNKDGSIDTLKAKNAFRMTFPNQMKLPQMRIRLQGHRTKKEKNSKQRRKNPIQRRKNPRKSLTFSINSAKPTKKSKNWRSNGTISKKAIFF